MRCRTSLTLTASEVSVRRQLFVPDLIRLLLASLTTMNDVTTGYWDTCTSYVLVSNIKKHTGYAPMVKWKWPASVKPRRDQQV